MTLIIAIAAFIGVATLVGGVAMFFRGDGNQAMEDRLTSLTTKQVPGQAGSIVDDTSVLSRPLDDLPGFAEEFFSRFGNIRLFLDQAGVSLTPSKLFTISAIVGGVAGFICVLARLPLFVVPLAAFFAGVLPFGWVYFLRSRRLAAFGKLLPEALELISRALRAGHSLASGFSLVAEEMADPIGTEFSRCYEEQNLGIPLDEALEAMTERVPNLDLRFFATAVILQRQTGGDLAEILDKIGELIRERFKIWGQIQALTGEGRLSGIVLLALPPVLFLAMFKLNPDYCKILFTDPLGQQMLGGAVVMQIVGALVIKKIIDIKV